ncbi:hypothetical protein [Rufibacter glacialis]|nr:hypothetical protein [Rufibacter glacialis]
MILKNSNVYYQSPSVTISYHEEQEIGLSVWNSPVGSHEVREAVLLICHTIERFGLTRWLSDTRNLRAFQEQDRQWTMEHIAPSLLSGALRKVAVLLPPDRENSAQTNHILHQLPEVRQYLLIQDFYEPQEALAWLLQESLQPQP